MNHRQRQILVATAAVVAAMVLFPPFAVFYPGGALIHVGYGFLFAPPIAQGHTLTPSVRVTELFLQCLVVGLVGVIAFVLGSEARDAGAPPNDAAPQKEAPATLQLRGRTVLEALKLTLARSQALLAVLLVGPTAAAFMMPTPSDGIRVGIEKMVGVAFLFAFLFTVYFSYILVTALRKGLPAKTATLSWKIPAALFGVWVGLMVLLDFQRSTATERDTVGASESQSHGIPSPSGQPKPAGRDQPEEAGIAPPQPAEHAVENEDQAKPQTGMFDDLIPKKGPGYFDHLIPKKPRQAE